MAVDLDTFNYAAYLDAIGVQGFNAEELNDAQKRILYNHATQKAYDVFSKELRQNDPFTSREEIKKEAVRQSLELFPSGRSAFNLPEERTTEEAFSMDEFRDFLASRPLQSEDISRDLKEFAKTRIHKTTEWQYPDLKDASKEDFVQLFMEHNNIDEFVTRSDILGSSQDPSSSSEGGPPRGGYKTGLLPALWQGVFNLGTSLFSTGLAFGEWTGLEGVRDESKELVDWVERHERNFGYKSTYAEQTWGESIRGGWGIIPFVGDFYSKLLETTAENWTSAGLNLALLLAALPSGGGTLPLVAVSNAGRAAKLANMAKRTWDAVVNANKIRAGLAIGGSIAVSSQEIGAMRHELDKQGFYDPENDAARVMAFGGLAMLLDTAGAAGGLGRQLAKETGILRDLFKGNITRQEARKLLLAREGVGAAAESMAMQAGKRPLLRFLNSRAGSTLTTAGVEMGTEAMQENLALDVALYDSLWGAISDIWKPGTHYNYPDRFKEGERFERTVGAALVGGLLGGATHHASYSVTKYLADRNEKVRKEEVSRRVRQILNAAYPEDMDGDVDSTAGGGLIPDVDTSIPGMRIYSTPDKNTLVAQYAGNVVEVQYDPDVDGKNITDDKKKEILRKKLVHEMTVKRNEGVSNISDDSITLNNGNSQINFQGRTITIEGDSKGNIAKQLIAQHNDKGDILVLDKSINITKEALGERELNTKNVRELIIEENEIYQDEELAPSGSGNYLDIPLNVERQAIPTFRRDQSSEQENPTFNDITDEIKNKGFEVLGEINPNQMYLYKDGKIYEINIRSRQKNNSDNFGAYYSLRVMDLTEGKISKPKRRDIRNSTTEATSRTGEGQIITDRIRIVPPFEGVSIMADPTNPSGAAISVSSFNSFVSRLNQLYGEGTVVDSTVDERGKSRGNSTFIRRIKFKQDQQEREITFMVLRDEGGRTTIFSHDGNKALMNFEYISDMNALGDDKFSANILTVARGDRSAVGVMGELGKNAKDLKFNVYVYNSSIGLDNSDIYIFQSTYSDENNNTKNKYWVGKYTRRKGKRTFNFAEVSEAETPYWERITNLQEATTLEEVKKAFGDRLLKTFVYYDRNTGSYLKEITTNENGQTLVVPTSNINEAHYSENVDALPSEYERIEVYMLRHPTNENALFVYRADEITLTDENNQAVSTYNQRVFDKFLIDAKKNAMIITSEYIPESQAKNSVLDYIRKHNTNLSPMGRLGEHVASTIENAENVAEVSDDPDILTDVLVEIYPNDDHKNRLINDIKNLDGNLKATERARERWRKEGGMPENLEDTNLSNKLAYLLRSYVRGTENVSENMTLSELRDVYRAMLLNYYGSSIDFLYNTSSNLLSDDVRSTLSKEITDIIKEIENGRNNNELSPDTAKKIFNRLRLFLRNLENRTSGALVSTGRTLSDFFIRDGENGYYSVATRIRSLNRSNTLFSLQHPLEPTGDEPIRRHNKATLFRELVLDGRVSDSVLADLISSEAIRVLNNQVEAINTIQQLENNGEDIEAYYEEGLISGFVASDGRIYLVADGIFEGRATGVYMHELGVHFKRLGMSDPNFQSVCSEVSRRVGDIIRENLPESERGSEANALMRAYEMAKEGGLNENNQGFWEEVVAYFVQENIDLGIGIAGRINSSFKRAALRLGMIDASKLTNKDIVNFAIGASRNASRFDFDIRYEDNGVNDDLIHFLTGTFPVRIRRGAGGVDQEREERQPTPSKLSFISAEAAQRLDVATGASYRMMAFDVAREMEERGTDERVIKLATGWHRTPDGAWMYELVDKNARLILPDGQYPERISLGEFLHHPELFEAYPNFRNMDVFFIPNFENYGSMGTRYDDSGNLETYINLKKELDPKQALYTLIHEIQHTIQDLQGRIDRSGPITPKGLMNPYAEMELSFVRQEYEGFFDVVLRNYLLPSYLDSLNLEVNEHGGFVLKGSDSKNVLFPLFYDGRTFTHLSNFEEYLRDNYSSIPRNFEEIPFIDYFSYDEERLQHLRESFDTIRDKYAKAEGAYLKEYYDGYLKYLDLLHEVEARITQARFDLSEEERRLSPISETEDLVRDRSLTGIELVDFASFFDVRNPNRMKKIVYGLGQQQQQSEVVENENNDGNQTKFSFVKDPNVLRKLRREPTNLRPPKGEKPIRLFRALQRDKDGNLYPVMGKTFKRKGSSQVTGEVIVERHIGSWTQADVRGDVVSHWAYSKDEDKVVPYVILGKGGGTPIPARFNPYIHVSDTPINDQFTSAWKRPEIVIAEVEIPWYVIKPGKRTPYIAQAKTPDGRIAVAKDPEGKTNWKSGPVNSQFPKALQRTVYISQYARIVNILTPENIADEINRKLEQSKEMGKEIRLPVNVVSPEVRAVLEDKHKVRLVPPMGIQGNWETEAPTDKDGRVIPLRKLHPLSSEEPPGLRTKFSMTSDPNRRNPNGRREVAGAPGVFRTRNDILQIDESRLPKGHEEEVIAYGAVRSSKAAQDNPEITNLISYFRSSTISEDVVSQYTSLPKHRAQEIIETDERLMFALAARWVLSNPASANQMPYREGLSLYAAVGRTLADSLTTALGTESFPHTDFVLGAVANAIGGLQNLPLHEGTPSAIDTSSFKERFDEMNIYAGVQDILSFHENEEFQMTPNGGFVVNGKEGEGLYRIIGADRTVVGNPEADRASFRSAVDRILQRGIVNHMQLETFFTEDKTLPVFLQTGNQYGALAEAAQEEQVDAFINNFLPLHLRERIVVHYKANDYAKSILQGALGIFYPFGRGKKMIHIRGWERTLGQVIGTIAHEASHFGWLMWNSPDFANSIGAIYDLNPAKIYQELQPYFQNLGISSPENVPLNVKVYMVNELYAKYNQSLFFEKANEVGKILGIDDTHYTETKKKALDSIRNLELQLADSTQANINVTEETAKAFAKDILEMTIGASVGRGVNALYTTDGFEDASGKLVPGNVVNIFVNDYGQRRVEGKTDPISKQVEETKNVINYWRTKGRWGKLFATFVLNNFPMRNGLTFAHLNVPSAALGEQIGTARANVLMGQVWRKVSEEMAGELRDRYDIYTDLEAALIDVGYDPSLVTGTDGNTFEETLKKLGLDSKKRLLKKAQLADEAIAWARGQIINGAINIRREVKVQADNLAARMRAAYANDPETGERVIGEMYSKMEEFAAKFNGDWQHRMYRAFDVGGAEDLRAMLYYLDINPSNGVLRLKEEQDAAQTQLRDLQKLLEEGAITPVEYRKAAFPYQRIMRIAQRLDALEAYVKMRIGSKKIASLKNDYSAYVVNVMKAEIEEVLSHSERLNSGILGDDHLNTISAVMQRELDERYELHRKYIEFLDPETNILKVLLNSVDQQNKILTKLAYNAELGEHILDSGMGVLRGRELGERVSSKIGYLEKGSFLQFIAIDPIFQEALEKEYNIQKDLRESMLGDIVSAWRANNTIYSLKLGMSNYIGNIGLLIAGGHFIRWENMALGGGVAWEHFKERMRFGQPDYEGAKKKVIELMRKHHVLGGTVSDTRMIVTNKGVHERTVDLIFDGLAFFTHTPVANKLAFREKIKSILEKFRQFYALGDEWIKPIIFMNNYDVFMAREEALHPELTPEQREDAAARAAAEQTLRETTAWELTSRMARELSANKLRFLTPDFIMHNFQMLRILAANYYRWWEAWGEFRSLNETVAEIQRSGREVKPDKLQLYRNQLTDELVRRGVGGLATASTYAVIATTGMGIVPIAVNAVLSALYGTKDDDDEEKEPGKRTGKGIGYGAFTPEEWDGAVRVTNWLTGGSNLYAPIFREDKWTMYGWNYARSNAMLTHIIPHIPNENWKPQDIPATFLRNLMDLQNGTMTQELVNYFLGKDRFGREIGVWEGFNKIMERSFTPGVVRQILGVTTGYEMSDTIFHSGKAIKIPELGGITLNKYDLRDVTNMLAYFIRDRQDSDKNYHRRNFLEAINKPSRMRDAELYAIIREFRENNRYEIGKADYLLNGLKQMGLSDSDIAHHLSIGRKSGNTIISREKAMAYVRGENILDTTFYDYLRRKRKSLIKDAKNLRMSRDELMVVLDNYQRAIRIYRQNMQAER